MKYKQADQFNIFDTETKDLSVYEKNKQLDQSTYIAIQTHNQTDGPDPLSSSKTIFNPSLLSALTTHQIILLFSDPFFSISLSTSTWIALAATSPPPEKLATLKRLARTSPTAEAAVGLENRPQSNEFLMECSTVDAVAIKSPVVRFKMLAVMNLTEM